MTVKRGRPHVGEEREPLVVLSCRIPKWLLEAIDRAALELPVSVLARRAALVRQVLEREFGKK